MVTQFQHREAGYGSSGHSGFATYWTQEMLRDLQGFGAQAQRDPFKLKGWQDRPATTPATNVEVTVPGAVHPEQIIVIGCHYDGEAFSTQSANDDASGCAIELGIAQALGNYWRTHSVYPARTLRFVIFDAEEQGLFGSYHYLNETLNGDAHNVVAMFNEEQNGIAYPLRYLGQTVNPLLPFYIETTPLQNTDFYPAQSKLSQAQRSSIKHFNDLMHQAVSAVFAQFQALGYQGLTYHDENNEAQAQPVFTPDQTNNVHIEDDYLGSSDQVPFTLAGAPCATFVGNVTYYGNNPPAWSYPYDQPQDTIQLMNTFADGSSKKAHALTLSLALPGMLTTWMLHQPDILGESVKPTHPIVAISDIGQTSTHATLHLDANASFDPRKSTRPLTYNWDFGDGSTATGIGVTHSYAKVGTYTLKLSTSSSSGTAIVSKTITVSDKPGSYNNPYGNYPGKGTPRSNPQVKLPQPNDTLTDQVVSLSPQVAPVASQSLQKTRPFLPQPFGFIAGMLLLLLVIAGSVCFARWITRKRNA
jgi:PKD repeat protein